MRIEFPVRVAGRAVSFVLAVFFLSGPIQIFARPTPEKIYRKVLPAVMTLEVENLAGERFIGSAVMGLKDDIAITAWHVVHDARSVWAVFADGTRLKVNGCVDSDPGRDLALIKLEKSQPRRKTAFSNPLQAVATRTFVIGAPKGYGFSISDGLVSQIRDVDGVKQYQISCPISPGNSGGPVLNERGEVIGIASWSKSDGQNLNFAIPVRELAHLDATKPVLSWEQVASSTLRPVSSRPVTSKLATASGPFPAEGFEEFTKRLERSSGKRVTVVVEEGGKEDKYQFIAPGSAQK